MNKILDHNNYNNKSKKIETNRMNHNLQNLIATNMIEEYKSNTKMQNHLISLLVELGLNNDLVIGGKRLTLDRCILMHIDKYADKYDFKRDNELWNIIYPLLYRDWDDKLYVQFLANCSFNKYRRLYKIIRIFGKENIFPYNFDDFQLPYHTDLNVSIYE